MNPTLFVLPNKNLVLRKRERERDLEKRGLVKSHIQTYCWNFSKPLRPFLFLFTCSHFLLCYFLFVALSVCASLYYYFIFFFSVFPSFCLLKPSLIYREIEETEYLILFLNWPFSVMRLVLLFKDLLLFVLLFKGLLLFGISILIPNVEGHLWESR